MSVVTIDPQIQGVQEDGSPSGAVRTVRSDGVGVWVPIRNSDYVIENTGSTASFAESGFDYNMDGSGQGINISVPATSGNGVRIWVPFAGRIFGVRWRLLSSAADRFTVVVDGVPVQVSGRPDRLVSEGITISSLASQGIAITHDNLDPTKQHTAEIIVTADVGGSARALTLFGWVLDKQAGYPEPRRVDYISVVPTACPTSATAVSTGTAGSKVKGIRQIRYYNSSGGSLDVTVNYNGTAFWKTTLAAGGCAELTFPELVPINSLFTHLASGSGVVFTVIGGY